MPIERTDDSDNKVEGSCAEAEGKRPVAGKGRSALPVGWRKGPRTVERKFQGTVSEFREVLEQQPLVKYRGTITQDEAGLVWQDEDGASIEFESSNMRVYVDGKEDYQIRCLIRVVAPFTRDVGAPFMTASGTARRICCKTFHPEGSGELALSVDEYVTMIHDPDISKNTIHRWVYGINENTRQKGWFPFSYTKAAQIEEPSADAEDI